MDTDTTATGLEKEHLAFRNDAMAVTPPPPTPTPANYEIGSQEWIKKVKASIRQLQPPMSLLDRALFELGDEIRQRRAAGCSTNNLAKLLTEHGAVITGPALARYLRNDSKATGKARRVPVPQAS